MLHSSKVLCEFSAIQKIYIYDDRRFKSGNWEANSKI